MGGVEPGAGRLDLDDFDATADRAAALETISAGSDDRRLDRVADSRFGRRVRSHRVVLIAAGALCLVVIATAVATEPLVLPRLDPELHVTTTAADVPDPSGLGRRNYDVQGYFRASPDGTHRTSYFLTPAAAGDTATYSVLGVAGPGIRESSAVVQPTGPGVAGATVSVTFDCWDPSALEQDDAYDLLVQRIDEHGRESVGRVPLPPADGWSEYVLATCARARLPSDIRLVAVDAAPVPGRRSVRVSVELSSALPVGAKVAVGLPDDAPYQVEPVAVGLLAGGRAHLDAILTVLDCSSAFRIEADMEAPDGEIDASPGLALDVVVPPAPEVRTAVHWSAADADVVDGAFDAACAGAPAVSIDVTATVRHPDDLQYVQRVDAMVVVESAGRAVTVHASVGADEVDFPAATARLSGGRAEIPLRLRFACSELVGPPVVQVTIDTADGAFPYTRRLDSESLSNAVLQACRQVYTPEDMETNGWTRPSGTPPV